MRGQVVATGALARAEALTAGVVTCAIEMVIWRKLALAGRALHYYHPIPMTSGLLLIAESQRPHVDWLSLAATVVNVATALNAYNTYYVHVVGVAAFVQPPAALGAGAPEGAGAHERAASTLLEDLFLPRYVDAFYPWGPVLQTLYALVVVGHCVFRAWVTAHVLRATARPDR